MATMASTDEGEGADLDLYLERVRALAPLIDDCAETVERDRRLPAELLAGLYEAGLFRLLLEKRFNGGEVCPSDFSRIIEEVVKRDASTAWCLCQANGCSMSASFLDKEIANGIWGNTRKGCWPGDLVSPRRCARGMDFGSTPSAPLPVGGGTQPGSAPTPPSSMTVANQYSTRKVAAPCTRC